MGPAHTAWRESGIYHGIFKKMAQTTAKLFYNGRSQAVRLPAEFRFAGTEVYIRKDDLTGDVILSRRPSTWEALFALIDDIPLAEKEAFLSDRNDPAPERSSPFE